MEQILAVVRTEYGMMKVEGGLHWIKGNSGPYFSLTCSYRDGGGADHDLILKYCPQFADLAALHLSNMDGSPMYPTENGFYHMGGSQIFGKPIPANWDRADRHFRLPSGESRKLAHRLFGIHWSETGGFMAPGARADAKARLAAWIDTHRPRWKQEAEACIRAHNLKVYGTGVR